jgi:hypothetical protein
MARLRYIDLPKGVRIMVFNATFNNISVISWWSALLVEETRVAGENHMQYYTQLKIICICKNASLL